MIRLDKHICWMGGWRKKRTRSAQKASLFKIKMREDLLHCQTTTSSNVTCEVYINFYLFHVLGEKVINSVVKGFILTHSKRLPIKGDGHPQ